jgi:hypothetical protein
MIVVAFAIALAATAVFAIVVLTSSPSSSSPTTPALEPTVWDELTDTQKACEIARVVGC